MLRRLVSTGVLAAGLALVVPAAPASAATVSGPLQPQTGTVRGVFTDRSGEPIADASVSTNSPSYNGWQRSARTDALGRYEIDDVPAGPVTVYFSDGTISQYAPEKPNDEQAQRYTVVPGLTTVVDERQVPTGTVQGRFTDRAGAPIARASVYLDARPFRHFAPGASTDADGRYSISGVPAGEVTLQFVTFPFRVWAHQEHGQAAARRYTLRGGQTLTVDESPLPTGTLTGLITDAAAGTVVVAHEVDGDGRYDTSTGADGRFSLTVPAGRWRVQLGARQWVPGKIDEAAAKVFRVTAGQSAEVTDALRPTGELRVKLRTGGSGVDQFSFTLWHGGTKVAYLNGTDAGSRTFENLLPGDYLFGYDEFFAPGTLRIEDAVPVKVRAGVTRTLEVTHPARATLSGRVTLPGGEPAPAIAVQADVLADGVTERRTAWTGTDGEWQMTGVFPETYRITLLDATRELTQPGGEVTVPAGGSASVDSTWQTGSSLTVTAVDAVTGDPVSGFCVAVVARFGDFCTEGSTVTAAGLGAGPTLVTLTMRDDEHVGRPDVPVTVPAGGRATLTIPVETGGRLGAEVAGQAADVCLYAVAPGTGGPGERATLCTNNQGKGTSGVLAPGTYQVFVRPPAGSDLGAQWYTADGGTGDQRKATKVTVKAGRTVRFGPIRLDPAGSVTGVVRDPGGSPVEHVEVGLTAFGLPHSELYPKGTDAQGRYTITGLGPYEWPLLFTPVADLPRQWSGATGNRFQADTVLVASGVTSTYDTTLSAGAKLAGTVTVTPGGTAWSGGRLTARDPASGDPLAVGDVPAGGGAYEFRVIGGGPVDLGWYLADPVTKATGSYDGNPVRVPANGRKLLDLTIG